MSDPQTAVNLFDQFIIAAGTFSAVQIISAPIITSIVALNMYFDTKINRRIDRTHYKNAGALARQNEKPVGIGYGY